MARGSSRPGLVVFNPALVQHAWRSGFDLFVSSGEGACFPAVQRKKINVNDLKPAPWGSVLFMYQAGYT